MTQMRTKDRRLVAVSNEQAKLKVLQNGDDNELKELNILVADDNPASVSLLETCCFCKQQMLREYA